ncbi:MAG: hypothetical protein ACTHXA_11335 [Gulosibacter sp.]|uniref:hypothetical protein n=1 Tax=Gulosibacter sp. TaxID=2817531 RepID=UPI003F92CAE5
MFSMMLIMNFVVLGIAGIMVLVGLLLAGYGVYALIKARRATESDAPSYSEWVEYPSEPGVEPGFEDAPRWADGIAGDADRFGAAGGSAGEATGGSAGEAAGGTSGAPTNSTDDVGPDVRRRLKNGREKSFIAVGVLLFLLGLFLLLNAIVFLA